MSQRIVLDTNVLVSALLTPDGVCARLLLLALDGRIVLVVDARILREYERVLRRPKFKLAGDAVDGVMRFLEETADTHVALPLHVTLPDEGDRPFFEVAAAAGVCLVTGNLRHYPESVRQAVLTSASPHGISVMLPADALKQLAVE